VIVGPMAIFIAALELAAKNEPYIGEVLSPVKAALGNLYLHHDDTVMMAEIRGVLLEYGIRYNRVLEALAKHDNHRPQ
jgi:hypothetical protein